METSRIQEKTFENMLEDIKFSLETAPSLKAVYTLLIGAGFSYGVIPTAKEVLRDAPVWLHQNRRRSADGVVSDDHSICREFWRNVRSKHAEQKFSISFDKDDLPENSSVTAAYQLLMSPDCPNGLITPELRRRYMRHACQFAGERNNPAHLYLACLLNRQRKKKEWRKADFCRTILTTNFDPLLQNALQRVFVLYYMTDRPEVMGNLQEDDHEAIHLVYTHGSVHRYILLNSGAEIENGRENNSKNLVAHFENHGVIVMGYGGWEDSTMEALMQSNQFSGNLYWCVRAGDILSPQVKLLLDKHRSCAFKVTIPSADEAMGRLFKELTDCDYPDILSNPINLLIDSMQNLRITGTGSKVGNAQGPQASYKAATNEEEELHIEEDGKQTPSFHHIYESCVENTISRLLLASQAYQDPDKFNIEEISKNNNPIQEKAIVSKYMSDALKCAIEDKVADAIVLWTQALEKPEIETRQKAQALFNRGKAYGLLIPAQSNKQLADYSTVIDMPDVSVEQKAKALINRGNVYGRLEPSQRGKQLADYTAAIEMSSVPAELKAQALIYRGAAYGRLKPPQREKQVADYTAVIEMPNASIEQVAKALMVRGVTYGQFEPPQRANEIADYTAVIEMPNAPVEEIAKALMVRAITYGQLEPPQRDKQIADYTQAIQMADAPAGLKAKLLINRGTTYGRLEPPQKEKQLADYTAVIELPDAPADQKADALVSRANTYGQLEPPQREQQFADYTAVIEMPDVLAEQKAGALLNRANAYGQLEPPQREKQLVDYTAVIEMPDAPAEQKADALVNRASIYGQLEPPQREQRFADYMAVIEMPEVAAETKADALFCRGVMYSELDPPLFEKALADYSAILEMPDVSLEIKANAHTNRGILRFNQDNDIAGLLEDASKAVEYNNDYVGRYNKGLALLFSNKPDEAMQLCPAAILECEYAWQIDGAIKLLTTKQMLLPEQSRKAFDEIMKTLMNRHELLLQT